LLLLGEFSEGLFHGFGVYARSDGMIYEGGFKQGQTFGPGLITFPNGFNGEPKQEGFFEGTRLVRREPVPEYIKRAKVSRERALKTNLLSVTGGDTEE